MRIQHNIAAMNAYRNYNINTSAVSKNLEKLSSGYKINRAGDDAAGLAISEKMRAQITGLDAATKNVKDGISLVKTAEGAMQEVQDMLNRMVNLATQSANGTYDNEVDRANLQKEVDQLQSEINRIADSSNFNGIKLLDGSLDGSVTYSVSGAKDLAILGTTTNTTVTSAGTSTILHKDATDAAKTTFEIKLENVSFTSTAACTVAITIGGTLVSASVASGSSATEIANSIAKGNALITIGGVGYNVTADGDTLKFEMTDASFNASTLAASFTGNFTVTAGIQGNGTQTGSINVGTQNVVEGTMNKGTILANTTTDAALTTAQITNGFTITVGDESYVFCTNKEDAAKNYGSNIKAVDISDLSADGKLLDENQNLSEALTRLTVAAKGNAMFTVGVTADHKLTFQERADYSGDADLTTLKGIQAEIKMGTISSKANTPGGKALTLQIGDTSDSYNQLKVSIGDIHTAALGISKINIGNQTGAANAVNKIKDAINSVSSIRGTLGATQNRLEHTQNNLSVMKENIQDAESTIRDTDIAEEMMSYTKNNILVQSAQAMLAQANQIPQGVLQLLG